MRQLFHTLLAVLLLTVGFCAGATAKRIVAPKMFMFGFAGSFNDTIVVFTDIQQVDSAWIDKKTNFLQSRDLYSSQLRDYLDQNKQLPYRTCVVFFDKDRARLEKKFMKMRKLYGKGKDGLSHFDVRLLEAGEFRFRPTDLTELVKMEEEQQTEYEEKPAKKEKKKDKKSGK